MKSLHISRLIAILIVALIASTGCDRSLKLNCDDAEFVIVDDDGSPITTLQSFSFDASAKLKIEARNIASTSVETPEGWGCDISIPKRVITITSPAGSNTGAALSGDITITSKGVNGSSAKTVLPVEAVEGEISLKCNEDISKPLSFKLEESKTFTFKASSAVTGVDLAGAPKDWTIVPDIANLKLTVTAPSLPSAETELSGDVVLTPHSIRGTKGTSVTISVNLNASSPILNFDKSKVWFKHDESQIFTIKTIFNVKTIDLANVTLPKGWTMKSDIANKKITIHSPASVDASNLRGGEVVIPFISESGEKGKTELDVMSGLCNKDDILAFGDAVAAGDDDSFALDGEVLLMNDINMPNAGRDVIIGAEDKPFMKVFNGNGKTIKIGIVASGAAAGLFHTLGAGAKVQDLNLSGSISSSIADATIGCVAIYNDGASLSGIKSSVSFNYGLSRNSGYYGGLVAYDRKSGSSYKDCHTSGIVNTKGIKYFGGLIGCIEADTEGSMTNCSNSGEITLDYGANDMSKARVAGCVGCTDKSKWTFTKISNTGNINFNFGKSNMAIYALGGAFGTANGKFDNCFNTGNVIDTDGMDAVSGTRRIGGFAGASAESGYPIIATDCYNTGNVTGVSNYIAGFIGISENGTEDATPTFTNCYNAGDVTVISKTTISGMFAGFLDVSYSYNKLVNCSNSGKVRGFSNRSAAGLVGCGADNLSIEGCANTGAVTVGCLAAVNPRVGRPFVAGIVAIRGSNPVVITKSKNTGAITAMVQSASDVQSAYVSEIVTVDGKTDVTSCDSETKTASANAVVIAILKDNWSNVLPGM